MPNSTIREDTIEMRDVITTIFVLCDELLTALNHREDPQVMMTDAEVMTVALTAAYFYGGHLEHARKFLQEHGYIPCMLSESRLNRRLHAIPEFFWGALFQSLASTFQLSNPDQMSCVDSFPVPVCDNIRIDRCRLYEGEAYRGYIASKRRYFYGLRVHMIVTASGKPVEFILRPGAESDVTVYKDRNFDLSPGATCFSDKMYTTIIRMKICCARPPGLTCNRAANGIRNAASVTLMNGINRSCVNTWKARLAALLGFSRKVFMRSLPKDLN